MSNPPRRTPKVYRQPKIDIDINGCDEEHRRAVDELLELTDSLMTILHKMTGKDLDDVIGDLAYILAVTKRNDRSSKHWKHMTLDVETQALICKMAHVDVNLSRLEERRMELTLANIKPEKPKRRNLRLYWHRLRDMVKKWIAGLKM